MKQLVQSPRSGTLELVEVPAPAVGSGQVLIRNHFSVMSPGTDMMAMEFARKSMISKARSRPDLVQQVLRKAKHDGPLPTYQAVVNRLDSPQVLGYSCAGVVEGVGTGAAGFNVGDRVAAAGAGYANHAEWVVVPENLVARVPDGVRLEQAAFATLGAIGLQGVRVGDPSLGEIVAVIGLGLIGQLVVQLLQANGCRVLGVDLDSRRMAQGLEMGAEWVCAPGDDHEAWKKVATGGYGVDLALVAAASANSGPVELAAELCRFGGRIVSIGATAMDLDRRTFYEKELELRMSMSYGPGRYDRNYEELGLDYPMSHVRWTENRNLQAFLALAASESVDPLKLDISRVDFVEACDSYEALARGDRSRLCTIFAYDTEAIASRLVSVSKKREPKNGDVGIGFLGAGNYAKAVLLPALGRCSGVARSTIVTATGPSARRTAERFGFERCSTDSADVLVADDVDLVFITTQHDTHASLAEAALRAGKAVWLEKPAAIDLGQLDALEAAALETGGFLTVGYNRRYSSHSVLLRDFFAERQGPLSIGYTVAAGQTPGGTWLTDPKVGGGRVIGEMCHFVELCDFLVGAIPSHVTAMKMGRDPEIHDSLVARLAYPDGSVATIQYLASMSPELPKERFELSAGGNTAFCDNFRKTTITGHKGKKTLNQDKGQQSAVEDTIRRVRTGDSSAFSLEDLMAVTRVTFAILDSVRMGETISLTGEQKDFK